LRARVKDGQFREDLFYRLAVVPIAVPPLRARRQDIPALAQHFLELVVSQLKAPHRVLTREAMRRLEHYDFPGNVRELRNLLERACILCKGEAITAADFPLDGFSVTHSDGPASILDAASLLSEDRTLRDTLELVEVLLLEYALHESGGNQAKAARRLHISRSDMSYKLKKYADRIDGAPLQGDAETA